MFRTKITSSAARVGATVVFATSREGALAAMQADQATLVILDLNSARTDPIGIVQTMKRDEALASIRVVGFVSHVDVNTVNAARAAGIDEVLARSAFTTQLPDLLASR